MNKFPISYFFIGSFLFGIWSCSIGHGTVTPYFEMPPDRVLKGEKEMFAKALQFQKNNKMESSIELWKRFLANNPRSFRAYNNFGMAYYTNDQLTQAISAFETGLALEPLDQKIKGNLKRALSFQITLLRENKNYDAGIVSLKRLAELSLEPEREKVLLEIETLEDKIFEQVKRSNTLEDYEAFNSQYPNSPRNSDEARRRIAKIKQQLAPMAELLPKDKRDAAPGMELKPFVPESMETPKSSMMGKVISKDAIEIVAEPKDKTENVDEFPEAQLSMGPAPGIMEKTPEKPVVKAGKRVATLKAIKKVKITTKTTPLRVRKDPSSKSEVAAELPAATIVPMFQETEQWYQIEYMPGKKGWISKKYSKLVN